MKKFVSMHDINKVFDDMDSVDYIAVTNVTDSTVCLDVHLRTLKEPKPGSKEWTEFTDRCLVLGKILDRKIQFVLVKAKFPKVVLDTLFRPFSRLT